MTIDFHDLQSNKTLLSIEVLHDKRRHSSIKSDLRLMSYLYHAIFTSLTKYTSSKTCLQSNSKYIELSYCLMKLSHFSCQQLISPGIVTIFSMWFLIYLFCYVWHRRCAVSHNTHAFPLHYFATANIFTWMKQIFVAMSTVLIFETFYWSNIIV